MRRRVECQIVGLAHDKVTNWFSTVSESAEVAVLREDLIALETVVVEAINKGIAIGKAQAKEVAQRHFMFDTHLDEDVIGQPSGHVYSAKLDAAIDHECYD